MPKIPNPPKYASSENPACTRGFRLTTCEVVGFRSKIGQYEAFVTAPWVSTEHHGP